MTPARPNSSELRAPETWSLCQVPAGDVRRPALDHLGQCKPTLTLWTTSIMTDMFIGLF